MTPTAKPTPAKLPGAQIMYANATLTWCSDEPQWDDSVPCAVIPCHTVTAARALIRVAGFFAMGEAEQRKAIENALALTEGLGVECEGKYYNGPYLDAAKAVLHLIASGGGRK